MIFKFFTALFFSIFLSSIIFAKVSLPAFFSDGMVLQRNSKVAIWGKTLPNTSVEVFGTWDNKTKATIANSKGEWKVFLSTSKAGGSYQLEINDGDKTIINDVMLGEVWLASGQSNMEMALGGYNGEPVANSKETIANSENNKIRFFIGKSTAWGLPLKNIESSWQISSPKTSPKFSAIAYGFAKNLSQKLGVPVGIIQVASGGTIIQAWMSAKSFETFPNITLPQKTDEQVKVKNTPTVLFNGMINPFVGYGIKGVLWYQGEQNRHEPEMYLPLFKSLVKDWRMQWGLGSFPFYYVQIAPFISRKPVWNEEAIMLAPKIPFLREAQLKAEKEIKNTGMVVTMDVSKENTIHPPDKQSVADRLANLALAKTYNQQDVVYEGPVFDKLKIKADTAILSFKNAKNGLKLTNNKSTNFEIAGSDQVFYPATAMVKGNKLIVVSNKVKAPLAVRYAFKAWANGDLFNNSGLPSSSFRTDNWIN